MLITKKIKVRAYGIVFNYYKKLGYECKYNDFIEVDIKHLSKQSNVMVEVKCEGGCEKNILLDIIIILNLQKMGF